MAEEIFRGTEVVVRTDLGHEGTKLVITFSPRSSSPLTEGFGEKTFVKHKIPAIHFLSQRNHWWQVAEMEQALKAVNCLSLERFDSITTYGTSMGAHGAMVFSKALRATRVLAFVPQFAINGRQCPWPPGWFAQTSQLTELFPMETGLSPTAEVIVGLDPFEPFDNQHLYAISTVRKVTKLTVPFAGHGAPKALNANGLLTGIVVGIARGTLDAAAARFQIRNCRRSSFQFWFALRNRVLKVIRRAALLKHANQQLELMAEAMLFHGRTIRDRGLFASCLMGCCNEFFERGETTKPYLWAERFVELFPNIAESHHSLSVIYAKGGRTADSLAAATRALELDGRKIDNHLWVSRLYLKLGRIKDATHHLDIALTLPGKADKAWTAFTTDPYATRLGDRLTSLVAMLEKSQSTRLPAVEDPSDF